MRPYECTILGKYRLKTGLKLKYPAAALRPTKNAVGLAYTRARSGHGFMPKTNKQNEIGILSLFGTLDSLRGGIHNRVIAVACSSCGCKCRGKLRLK